MDQSRLKFLKSIKNVYNIDKINNTDKLSIDKNCINSVKTINLQKFVSNFYNSSSKNDIKYTLIGFTNSLNFRSNNKIRKTVYKYSNPNEFFKKIFIYKF